MTYQKKGIYLEVKRAPSHKGIGDVRLGHNKYHAYLVYRDGKGGEHVLRGGPVKGPRALLGDIQTEDRPLKGSKDGDFDINPRSTRFSRKLPIEESKLAGTWEKMQTKSEQIQKAGFDYDLIPLHAAQNSNSYVAALLEESGVDLKDALPDGVKEDQLPGIKNTLSHAPDENPFSTSEQLRKNQGKAWDSKHRQTRPEPEKPKADTKGAVPTPEQRKAFRHSKPVTAPDTPKPKAEGAPPNVQQKKADPAARKLLQDFLKPGDAAAEAMLNPVGKWTEADSEAVMKKRTHQGRRLGRPKNRPSLRPNRQRRRADGLRQATGYGAGVRLTPNAQHVTDQGLPSFLRCSPWSFWASRHQQAQNPKRVPIQQPHSILFTTP